MSEETEVRREGGKEGEAFYTRRGSLGILQGELREGESVSQSVSPVTAVSLSATPFGIHPLTR